MESDKKSISQEELAKAFLPEKQLEKKSKDKNKKTKESKPKKLVFSMVVFVVGLITLVAGVVFLVLNLTKGPGIQDGEYLVSAENWVLDEGANCADEEQNCTGEPKVIWDFIEIGKGTLTTNNHVNDYDFTWVIKDGKLIIETEWLYDLSNEYKYTLDQGNGILILTDDDNTYEFVANFATE